MVRLLVNIDNDVVYNLRQKYYTWTDIALQLGVTTKTLYNWRTKIGFVEPFHKIDSANQDHLDYLDQVVINASHGNVNVGERLTIGYVRGSSDINPSRAQIRDSLKRVDPDGIAERSINKIRRRRYEMICF